MRDREHHFSVHKHTSVHIKETNGWLDAPIPVVQRTGIFVFVLSLIFCCYFISKLRQQAQSERFGYREVILKGDPKKLNLHGQTCAVCLEDFKVKDELGVLPCQHAFHRRCVVKWLEVRCVCPMCNKPLSGSSEQHQSIGTLLDELV
ncbi:RING finger protein 122-like isoform X3 [Myxocyprinus asiaticus]|uniref:RING finger protein 122-like isoform X3 n=1 Tax=Myxocyprinus asiaticus TaxID=70543 RepID=UPI00222205A9|nr:RING finger protein 122-like isoform X3 [Myxocyprinus asiaticus]